MNARPNYEAPPSGGSGERPERAPLHELPAREVRFKEALARWQKNEPYNQILQVAGEINKNDLQALIDIPFEIMLLVTRAGRFINEGISNRVTNQLLFTEKLGLPSQDVLVSLHNHTLGTDNTIVNYPSYADYFNIDSARKRLDIIVTPAGIYDFSFYPDETVHPVDGFANFAKQHGVMHSRFHAELAEEETGKHYRILYQLPHTQQQLLYAAYEAQRPGPPQRQISWRDPKIAPILQRLQQS